MSRARIVLADTEDTSVCSDTGLAILLNGLAALGPKDELEVWLSSRGGDTAAALAIYDALDNAPCGPPREIRVFGPCHSAGVIILQAGERRLLGASTTLVCHPGEWSSVGPPKECASQVEEFQKQSEEVVKILAQRSGLKLSTIRKIERRAAVIPAEKAVELGLADEVL